MRRLPEPHGGPERRDVLAATDIGAKSDEADLSYDAWAAYQKPRKREGALWGNGAIIPKGPIRLEGMDKC